MITKYIAIVLLSFLAILIVSQGCNPDCNSASTQNIVIDPGTSAILAGRTNQILLRSQPSNFILDRKIFMDDPIKGARTQLMETSFTAELNGLIVTIPEELSRVSTPAIYVDDPDCSSEVIFVNTLPIQEEDFFFFSDVFVVPPMPLIIVPTVPVLPPVTGITNEWITPYDRSYCIWFVPHLDKSGNELSTLREYNPESDQDSIDAGVFDKFGSREFIVCDDKPQRNPLAGVNPVSGIVDKETGIIQIAIDRTQHGLGVERFSGMFIEDQQVPDTPEWRNGGPCVPGSGKEMMDFMLITSETTGQQILMIKADT